MDASCPKAFEISGAAELSRGAAGAARLEDEVVSLFGQFRERLLRYLVTLGMNIPDAEEVVQEVFLALFQHLRQGKPRDNLRGWIFRVAHNLGLKQRGRVQQRPEQSMDAGTAHADTNPNPEEQMLTGERQQRLQSVLRALPEQDRLCLYLRAEGLRYREIAEALDISLGAVSLSLGRSLARLGRADGR